MAKKKNPFKLPKQKVFVSPGNLTYIGKQVSERTSISRLDYTEESYILQKHINLHKSLAPISTAQKMWLDIDGVHEETIIKTIGEHYKLHPVLMEDILNTTQKPKFEFYEEEKQLFVVLRMLHLDEANFEIEAEQISLVLGTNWLLSFQEKDHTDIFTTIHDRFKIEPPGRVRRYGVDYLLYALLDLIIDQYYVVLDKLIERVEQLEEQVLFRPDEKQQVLIYSLKKEIGFMKRSILPVRDILSSLIREDSELVGNKVNVYLRDAQDHLLQILESLESLRDTIDNVLSTYQSALSNKMNAVMKTLTVFTVIFMPLSFIAGIYGMNFSHMPELSNPNGYYYALAGMGIMGLLLLIYFKWREFL